MIKNEMRPYIFNEIDKISFAIFSALFTCMQRQKKIIKY